MIRTDREDTTRQRAALEETRAELRDALSELAWHSKAEGKVAGREKGEPDTDRVDCAVTRYQRAREAHHQAHIDLQSALGDDL